MRELSLHILDVLENALTAGANRIDLIIDEDTATDRLIITIQDNGCGMSREQVERIFDPFFTTRHTRRVGLGVPMFKAAAERCNGGLTVESQVGQGTKVEAVFQHSHIDRAPLGDIQGTLLAFVLSDPASTSCDLHYVHIVDGRQFEFCTADMRAELGEVPLSHPSVREWLRAFIAGGEAELNGPPNG